MGDGDGTESDDRVLVRPYVKQQPPAQGPPRVGATAELPVVKEPVPPPPPDTGEKDNRRVLWLVGGALVLILALAGGVIAIWPGGDEDTVAPPRSAVWPQVSARPTLSVQQPASPSVVNSVAASSLLASRSASASASSSAPPSTAPASSAPAAGTQPPPTTDRAGAIKGAGGHCLDVKGGIALIGSPLSVYDCNGTLSQQWTMTTAGTLRNSGGCAGADGTSVRMTSCGDDDSGQWRAGRDGTLVNVGSGQCLTGPAGGGGTGGSLRTAACGGSGQRWTLP